MARALQKVDHLIEKVGIGIVQTVETKYQKYLADPSEKNAKNYVIWRLRLHRRLKNNVAILEEINEARTLGLMDIRPGKTCWDCVF
jgi:predicted HTH transcriptional regulator